jgi:hypothetical protein
VNIVNRESNRFSPESDSSRNIRAKIECREEGGGTVEFVQVLALSKRAAVNFANYLCRVCLFESNKSTAAKRILRG